MARGRKMAAMCGKLPWTHKYEPYKKERRRPRESITGANRKQRALADTSFLLSVPAEVLNMILDQLSVREISVFSMVSKEITKCVVDYISTLVWRKKIILQSSHCSTSQEQRSTVRHYRDLGLLFKRCTLLQPTKDRLKFIFSKFSQIPCFQPEQCAVPDCSGFIYYGALLQALIAGWDELECHRVFNFLCDLTNLLQKTEAVFAAKPGAKLYQELQLRLFCRRVFLDPWSNQLEGHFWLMLLLKPWPLVNQAKLLFILYGPLLPEGSLAWQNAVVTVLPHNSLWELAKAILVLFTKLEVKGWSADSLLAIFEELIGIPGQWHVENVARLLVLCGSGLCYTILASKALNGHFSEISRLIVFIVLVCQKDGYHISWAVKLVQAICKVLGTAPEKFSFIQELENTFSDVSKEFFELSAAVNHEDDRELFQSFCLLLDSSARFHSQLLHVLLA